jgi:DNA replication protein DnaC
MSFLVISGPPGTGKTYLCAAIFANMLERCFWGRYFLEEELFRTLRKGISSSAGDYSEHLLHLIDHNLVIFDDFGSMGHTDWREEVWTTAIDSRYRSMLPTVITTNLNRKEISELYGERVASRVFDHKNTIIELDEKSYDWRTGV